MIFSQIDHEWFEIVVRWKCQLVTANKKTADMHSHTDSHSTESGLHDPQDFTDFCRVGLRLNYVLLFRRHGKS